MSIESVILSNYLILCHLLLHSPSIVHSTRVFSNESALPIWSPKYSSFSLSPSNQYSGLISFMTDWFDLLTVQGTLKSLLQNHSFFVVFFLFFFFLGLNERCCSSLGGCSLCNWLHQNHSLKASILRHSAFFMVQLSHRYMTTGKTIALTRWTFASKVNFSTF